MVWIWYQNTHKCCSSICKFSLFHYWQWGHYFILVWSLAIWDVCVASSSISNMTYPWKSSEKKTVREAMLDNRWVQDISGSLPAQVILEFLTVWDLIQEVQLQPGVPDQHHWLFTPSGEYTVHCKICIWSLSRWVNLLRACPKDLEELGTSALQILHMDGLSQ